ncbi:hypothetical protein E2562_035224 [Oryza meyeriana var. granulata]|uniref:Uncharacterized protein n=1 Tax=Oryza meyeriana var. granulata TaxID=110450 RepID=A0A6G1DRY3_9ORYZ|nr:hypothetical protein E2562_035224 [Oryza meyeriana var. granulata]
MAGLSLPNSVLHRNWVAAQSDQKFFEVSGRRSSFAFKKKSADECRLSQSNNPLSPSTPTLKTTGGSRGHEGCLHASSG